jgi:hypothetical protein
MRQIDERETQTITITPVHNGAARSYVLHAYSDSGGDPFEAGHTDWQLLTRKLQEAFRIRRSCSRGGELNSIAIPTPASESVIPT